MSLQRELQQQNLTSHVDTECPRRKVNRRKNTAVCTLEIVRCDYHLLSVFLIILSNTNTSSIGCKVVMACKEVNEHKQEMMEHHLSLSINELM